MGAVVSTGSRSSRLPNDGSSASGVLIPYVPPIASQQSEGKYIDSMNNNSNNSSNHNDNSVNNNNLGNYGSNSSIRYHLIDYGSKVGQVVGNLGVGSDDSEPRNAKSGEELCDLCAANTYIYMHICL